MNELKNLIYTDSNGNVLYNQWIEWDHILVPNKPNWWRELVRTLLVILGHCFDCTALDGCYLVERNMPKQPLHNSCHCKKKYPTYSKVKNNAIAECDIRKFTEYIFDSEKSKGKIKIFTDLGYSVNHSSFLQQEFCKQALKQYLSGNYLLKNLDRNGQRLAIKITLNEASFYSGWLLCPEGKIKNTTPFGGWINEKI